ncbi:hypothetical protein T484DRAFT_1775461 [Baffinella frigidus]|nr:hypothetical protein T484DRAFT_1775461 [Cryptophyta sp. CCMP2293]
MLSLTAVQHDAAPMGSALLPARFRTPQRATSMPQLLGAVPALRPADVFQKQFSQPNLLSAFQSSELSVGSKIFLQCDGTLVHSTRQRHGGFLTSSMHPILASRHRWRTTAAACLGTHDETLLCALATPSCTDASSMGVSSSARTVIARPQSSAAPTEVHKGTSTGKIQHFRRASTPHLRPVSPSTPPPRREVLRLPRRLAPVDEACPSSSSPYSSPFSSDLASTVLASSANIILLASSFRRTPSLQPPRALQST